MTTPHAASSLICDFCSGDRPVCYFPCAPFKVAPEHPAMQPFPSGDRFYACGTCRPLVEASDWDGLRRHCAQADLAQALQPHAVSALWEGFARHRQGPAVDIAPGSNPEEDRRAAPHDDAALRAAAAAWHGLCEAALAVVGTCSDNEEGPAADPAKIPTATPDAAAAVQALRAVVASEESMVLHEVDAAARRVSAALPIHLPGLVQELLGSGGGEPELALAGAVMLLNGALHDADTATERLG